MSTYTHNQIFISVESLIEDEDDCNKYIEIINNETRLLFKKINATIEKILTELKRNSGKNQDITQQDIEKVIDCTEKYLIQVFNKYNSQKNSNIILWYDNAQPIYIQNVDYTTWYEIPDITLRQEEIVNKVTSSIKDGSNLLLILFTVFVMVPNTVSIRFVVDKYDGIY